MVELKTSGEVDAMAPAGRAVADALAAVRGGAAVGMRLDELDAVAYDVIVGAGAKPVFLGYQPNFATSPFPGAICASVNDAVLHGIPGGYRLADGDLLSVDCGAELDGWVGDAACTFAVGTMSDADRELVETTEAALRAGVAAMVAGARIGDISAAIGAVGRSAGYGINTDFGGHGVGRTMHEAPSVPNEGRRRRGMPLRPGLVLAIEPWFISGGGDGYVIDGDGWTLRSADGSRSAHAEHTVAVTEEGPRLLTVR